MVVYTYQVWPCGESFETSLVTNKVGDGNEAHFHAHVYAARQAAEQKLQSYVTRVDTGDARYGFDTSASFTTTSDLYKIMQMGMASCWDYHTVSWLPLPDIEAEVDEFACEPAMI